MSQSIQPLFLLFDRDSLIGEYNSLNEAKSALNIYGTPITPFHSIAIFIDGGWEKFNLDKINFSTLNR